MHVHFSCHKANGTPGEKAARIFCCSKCMACARGLGRPLLLVTLRSLLLAAKALTAAAAAVKACLAWICCGVRPCSARRKCAGLRRRARRGRIRSQPERGHLPSTRLQETRIWTHHTSITHAKYSMCIYTSIYIYIYRVSILYTWRGADWFFSSSYSCYSSPHNK